LNKAFLGIGNTIAPDKVNMTHHQLQKVARLIQKYALAAQRSLYHDDDEDEAIQECG
jgi:hypothetical protein